MNIRKCKHDNDASMGASILITGFKYGLEFNVPVLQM